MPKLEYTTQLDKNDKLRVLLISDKKMVVYFVVQYFAKIKGKWKTIIRTDNNHGFPHKHVYHLHSKEFKLKLEKDNNQVFNKALKEVKVNYQKIKENYLNS